MKDRKNRRADEREMLKWAKSALKGPEESASMMGVWDNTHGATRWRFYLQVGYFICVGRPMIMACPRGQSLPPKLEKVADAIVYWDTMEEMAIGIREAMIRLGVTEH